MLTSTVSSCRAEKNVHEKDKGNISSDDDSGTRYRSCDDGESRLNIRAEMVEV